MVELTKRCFSNQTGKVGLVNHLCEHEDWFGHTSLNNRGQPQLGISIKLNPSWAVLAGLSPNVPTVIIMRWREGRQIRTLALDRPSQCFERTTFIGSQGGSIMIDLTSQ